MKLSCSNILKKLCFLKRNPAPSGLNPQYFFIKKPTLKKLLTSSQKKGFLIFTKTEPCNFQPKP